MNELAHSKNRFLRIVRVLTYRTCFVMAGTNKAQGSVLELRLITGCALSAGAPVMP